MQRFGSVDHLISHCRGAYSENTLRGYAADLRCFESWVATHGVRWLPASAETIAA